LPLLLEERPRPREPRLMKRKAPPPPRDIFLNGDFFSVLAVRSRVNGVLEYLKRIKNGPQSGDF